MWVFFRRTNSILTKLRVTGTHIKEKKSRYALIAGVTDMMYFYQKNVDGAIARFRYQQTR